MGVAAAARAAMDHALTVRVACLVGARFIAPGTTKSKTLRHHPLDLQVGQQLVIRLGEKADPAA
jgi:hypothetical protein